MRLVTVYMYSCKLLCGLYCLLSGGQTEYIYTNVYVTYAGANHSVGWGSWRVCAEGHFWSSLPYHQNNVDTWSGNMVWKTLEFPHLNIQGNIQRTFGRPTIQVYISMQKMYQNQCPHERKYFLNWPQDMAIAVQNCVTVSQHRLSAYKTLYLNIVWVPVGHFEQTWGIFIYFFNALVQVLHIAGPD